MKQNAKYLLVAGLAVVLGLVVFLQSKKQNIAVPTVNNAEETVITEGEQTAGDSDLDFELEQEIDEGGRNVVVGEVDSEATEDFSSQSSS